MSLKRDPESGIWQIGLSINGRRVQKSAGTRDRRQARKLHDKIASDAWRMKHGIPGAYRWEDACVVYLQSKRGKKTYREDVQKLMRLQVRFREKLLTQLTPAVIEQAIDPDRKLSPATRNRYRSVIAAVFKTARENDMIQRVPAINPEREPDERVRWLSKEEARKLSEALSQESPALGSMMLFALHTGLRMANVMSLRWTQIEQNYSRLYVEGGKSKSGRKIVIPLNINAAVLLDFIKINQLPPNDYVFLNSDDNNKPFRDIPRAAWAKALARAGIKDFHWHDLRHTWATWHVTAGTPLEILMKLGGWSSYKCVLKYAHFSPDFTAKFADNVKI